jgi:hypothetical protein
LAIFFGPILLPKAIGYYNSVRRASRVRGLPIQKVPVPVQAALYLLSSLCFFYLVQTLPYFAPENLFTTTDSRLQIPVDVLFNRVTAIRPGNALTASDQALRAKFVNMESRLLYFQFGPDVLADCPFCNSDEPKSYLYYALPDILWPHIANLLVLAVVTSPSWTARYGLQWRTSATIGAAVVAALEVYLVSAYNYQLNAKALRLPELDMFYWSMRTYRYLALAALDGSLAWVLYLSSTNRAFAQPPAPSQRVDEATRTLFNVKSRLNALAIVRNTTMRDEDLRSRSQAYWAHEVRLMGEVMEEREVIEGVNDALSNRLNIQAITQDAESYAASVLQPGQGSGTKES